ncbi:putative membrane protein [Agrobacterium vitis]|nr:putative membrane protein [Agrobacterium vitis]
MKPFALLTIATLMAAPAFAQSAFAQSAAEKTGINSLVGAAPTTGDFVREAITSDMFEIQSSKLAVERADPPTVEFAQQMIKAHQKTSAELKKLMAATGILSVPSIGLTASQTDMLTKLKGLQGAAFIEKYTSDQQKVHEDAVDLFKRYAEGGDNTALKEWAAKTLPTLEHHLAMAKQLNT